MSLSQSDFHKGKPGEYVDFPAEKKKNKTKHATPMIINDADVPQFATPKRLEFENKIIAKTSYKFPALTLTKVTSPSLHFPVDQLTVSEVFDFASTLYIVGIEHSSEVKRNRRNFTHLFSLIVCLAISPF